MQDVYDRNITIYNIPGTEIWKQVMSTLPFPFPELAERTYITTSFDEFNNITKYHLLKQESFFFHHVESTFKKIILYQYYREHMLKSLAT